jgi:hypothetical protein
MRAPKASLSCFDSARPKPKPVVFLFPRGSTLSKGSKLRLGSSAAMPGP